MLSQQRWSSAIEWSWPFAALSLSPRSHELQHMMGSRCREMKMYVYRLHCELQICTRVGVEWAQAVRAVRLSPRDTPRSCASIDLKLRTVAEGGCKSKPPPTPTGDGG